MSIMECKPCRHAQRSEIDAQIIKAVPFRAIAATFGLSLGSISRHRAHVRDELGKALRRRESTPREQNLLLKRVEKLLGEAEELLAMAKSKENIAGATGAINAAGRLLELIGKISGELQPQNGAGIHLTMNRITNNTTIYNHGDDTEIALLVSEATRGFDLREIDRLRLLAEGKSLGSTTGSPALNP